MVLTSTETIRLIREGRRRGGGGGGIYLSLHCQHQNDFCIKMGSDESHFNVSLIERDKVTRLSTDHKFGRERRAEADSNRGPSAYQSNTLPIGQTGSHYQSDDELMLNVLRCHLSY